LADGCALARDATVTRGPVRRQAAVPCRCPV